MAKKKDDKIIQNSEHKNDVVDVSNEDEPDFDDPEDFVDDIDDEDLMPDILKLKPRESDGVENVIVVDGVPKVEPERLEKLQVVINKIFSRFGGTIVNEYYPKNENGSTKGYIFLEYANAEEAKAAVGFANNYKLDKAHTLQVNLFTDFEKYANIPEEWEPPTPLPYKVQTDLHSFLLDNDAYDQFSVVCSSEMGMQVQIWQNSQPDPTELENRNNFTDEYVKWSPLGTYLVTFHKPGVGLWGGPNFTRIARFPHPGARFIDFSPCENYLVTYSGMMDEPKIIIWDIRTGQEMRSFLPEGPRVWPIFRWSKDDKYLARMGNDLLSIYETPSFGLLDKKSVKVPGIRDFQWSPTDNVLAYWVAEDKNVPARVTLLEIPNRNEIRNKNLFNVADCKIHWQKSGDYLCVKVDRYAKLRKEKNEVIGGEVKYSGMYYNFEIFHMREKQIPVDSVEIKESIHAFAWEPVGSKFAIIHGEPSISSISFYEAKTGQAPTLLRKFEKKPFTHMFWSPMGRFIVLVQLVDQLGQVGVGGALEFVDSHDFVIMNSTDHYQATDVEWDPTGRYITTGVSGWKVKHDTGYWIWTFQGRILKRVNLEKFRHFLWRPRPPTLLSAKEQSEIKKNLKKYSSQFESKDRMRMSKASKELIEKRAALMKQFSEFRQKKQTEWAEQRARRLELRNHVDTDSLESDSTNVEEEVVEFLIKEETTIIE